jgi:hypothetical protein
MDKRSHNELNAAGRKYLFQCTTCDEDFGGINAFDRHRIGDHEHLYSPEHPNGRRCRTPDEMEAIRMYCNRFGRWSQPPGGLAKALGSDSEAPE